MAVSGADWRKSTDGYWADAAGEARCGRPEDGEVSAAGIFSARVDAVRRTLADNTDNGNHEDVPNTVETDDRTVAGPLAIGVFTEAELVCGDDIYLRYFIPGPDTRRDAVIVE